MRTEQQYPTWFLEFQQNVQDMRDAQKRYFAQPTNEKLRIAKAAEAKVDIFLSNAEKQGLVTHKLTPPPSQPQMF